MNDIEYGRGRHKQIQEIRHKKRLRRAHGYVGGVPQKEGNNHTLVCKYQSAIAVALNTGKVRQLAAGGKWLVPAHERPVGWERMGLSEATV